MLLVVTGVIAGVIINWIHDLRVSSNVAHQVEYSKPQETPPAEHGRMPAVTDPIKPPSSPRYDLTGEWLASYSGGLVRVNIEQSGTYLSAKLIRGWDAYIPKGQVAFWGTYDSNVFSAHQICSYAGFKNPFWVTATITVGDMGHFIEEDTGGQCGGGGFPLKWERKPLGAPDYP